MDYTFSSSGIKPIAGSSGEVRTGGLNGIIKRKKALGLKESTYGDKGRSREEIAKRVFEEDTRLKALERESKLLPPIAVVTPIVPPPVPKVEINEFKKLVEEPVDQAVRFRSSSRDDYSSERDMRKNILLLLRDGFLGDGLTAREKLDYLKEFNKLESLYKDKDDDRDVKVVLQVYKYRCNKCGHVGEVG